MNYLEKEDVLHINFLTIQHVGGNFVPTNNFLHEENLDYLSEAGSCTSRDVWQATVPWNSPESGIVYVQYHLQSHLLGRQ